jgi:ATP/maltotriose-dependent transcriptional regulator MalT
MRAVRDHAWSLVGLGEVLLLAGRRAEAAHAAMRALEQARTLEDRGVEAWAHRLRGEIDLPDRPAAAAQALQAGLALAEDLHMLPLAAHCQLGLARAALATGDRADGARRLDEARRLYADLGMQLWLTRATAEIERSG